MTGADRGVSQATTDEDGECPCLPPLPRKAWRNHENGHGTEQMTSGRRVPGGGEGAGLEWELSRPRLPLGAPRRPEPHGTGCPRPPLSNGTRVHAAQAPPALRPLPARRELPPRGLDCAASTTPLGFAPDPCEAKRHLPRGLLGHSPAPPTPQLALSPGHGTWQLPMDPPRLCPPPHRRSRRVGACGLPDGPQPQLEHSGHGCSGQRTFVQR